MPLTILSVAYPLTSVGRDAVGGSEQILTAIDEALVRGGHRSLVLAAENSRISGTLIGTPTAGRTITPSARQKARRIHQQRIEQVLNHHSVDVVHMHSLDFYEYLPTAPVPVLATLHLPPDWYPRRVFELRRRHFCINCVSKAELRQCPRGSRKLSVIENGVNVEALCHDAPLGNYCVAMGRICPEKGFHLALDAAQKAGVELRLAGEVAPLALHKTYFVKEIAARLDSQRNFLGPLNYAAKRQLLTSAQCLIVSSLVAETSSLVAMESLACGTPIVAFRIGALPEIVEHGRTGFIVDTVAEMAMVLRKVGTLDRSRCRQAARRRFSERRMTKQYLDLYSQLASEFRTERGLTNTN